MSLECPKSDSLISSKPCLEFFWSLGGHPRSSYKALLESQKTSPKCISVLEETSVLRRGDKNILGLEVAVDNMLGMNVLQAFGYLDEYLW